MSRWIAYLGDHGQHAGDTIAAYVSGISTWWRHRTAGDGPRKGPNPTQDDLVRDVLAGVRNCRAQVDQQHRLARYVHPLMMDTVASIKRHADPTTYAAAALGVAALLRPNALLGSNTHKERGVRCEHIQFFSATRSPISRPATGVLVTLPTDSYFTLFIPIDKTDQRRQGHTKVIGARTAVEAVWDLWKASPSTGPLLRQPSGSPLNCKTLVQRLREALRLANYEHADVFTARAFRRGGASTMAEAGADDEAIADAGSWSRQAGTFSRYIGQETRRQQQLAESRKMEFA